MAVPSPALYVEVYVEVYMACKGILPDGNQCDAPDQYVDPATGLCGSCGAPASTALVPVGSTEMMADPEVAALYDALQPKAQQFLRAFVETLSIDAGAEAAGVHRNSHYYWKKKTPGYREVFDVAIREVKDRWNRHLTEKTMNGLKEVMYDSEGNVKHTRMNSRQSSRPPHRSEVAVFSFRRSPSG